MNQQQIPTYAELDWQELELILRAARRERSEFIASMISRLRRRKDAEQPSGHMGGFAQAS